MEKKKYENSIVYAALTLVLTVLAVLVIVTGIASRRARPNDLPDTTASVTDKNAGASGHDTAEHNPGTSKPGKDDTMGVVDRPDKETNGTQDETSGNITDVDAPSELPDFIAPIDGVVSKSHNETSLVYSLTMGDYRTHTGVDIAATDGAKVVAAADGVIADVWQDPLWGVCVSISHEGDGVSIYRNLTAETLGSLEKGAPVAAGDVIGNVGDTALYETAEEAHLHFEMKVGGVSVDPEEYIEFGTEDVFAD